MNRLLAVLLSMALLLTTAPMVLADDDDDDRDERRGRSGRATITEIVAASGGTFDRNGRDYDILLNAVLAAGLEGALADPSARLTVFAPNDAAFVRTARDLGYGGWDEAGAWEFLVSALTGLGGGDPIPVLTNILLYHVAPGYYSPWRVIFSRSIPTLLDGAEIRPRWLTLRDNDPDLRDPRLVLRQINIKASNGVIHTINRVLIPIDI